VNSQSSLEILVGIEPSVMSQIVDAIERDRETGRMSLDLYWRGWITVERK